MIIHTPLFQPGGLNRIEFSGTSSFATFSSLSATASWATFSGTASYSRLSGTASYATFSGTASYSNLSGTASWATFSGTASYATLSGTSSVTRYTRGRYAFWTPFVSTDPTGMSASYTATSPDNQGANGIRITSVATAGQNGRISWDLGSKVDWKQDFRMEVVAYLEPTGSFTMGDGFVLSAGASSFSANVYGNTPDGALKFRLFTFGGAVDQTLHPTGASLWQNDTKISQGLLGTASFSNNWIKYTVEVAWNVATGRRHAVVYMSRTSTSDYGGKYPIAGADVTSWEPGGGVCGVFFSTGAARSNQWVQQVMFETM